MKKYSDGLVLAWSPISISDLVSQVLSSLNEEYNPVVGVVQGKLGVNWTDL